MLRHQKSLLVVVQKNQERDSDQFFFFLDRVIWSRIRGVVSCSLDSGMFADMLSELHHLDHTQQELIYLSSLRSSLFPIVSAEPFSTFDDKLRYCGSTPSVGYCKAVFVDWMRGVEP
jgi:hypothetical protein